MDSPPINDFDISIHFDISHQMMNRYVPNDYKTAGQHSFSKLLILVIGLFR